MNYDYGITPDMVDSKKLLALKFTPGEVQFLRNFIMNFGPVTAARAVKFCNLSPGEAKKLKYMYDICAGVVTIETPDDISKHFRKMFGAHKRIGIYDLAISKIQKVPRKAIIGGITDSTFGIYNSKRRSENEKMYNVVDVTTTNIVVRTDLKPILKYKQSRKVDGVIEIKAVNKDGTIDLAVNKQFSRLCNRFIVVASLRRPEFHHGLVEMIAIEGTKVYVYNQTMGDGEMPNYRNGTQRVYDYGFTKQELCPKLMAVSKVMYTYIKGVYQHVEKPNSEFTLFKRVEKPVEEEEVAVG